jgi:3'-5' exonuclease
MSEAAVSYLVFDIESVADGPLVSRLRYPGEGLDGAAAIQRYRAELMAAHDSDFIPYTFQLPISVAVAKVGSDFRLLDVAVLDEAQFRPHIITEHFWRGWEKYQRPTLVSFNGRTFDIPLLELAAFRYGLSIPGWFNLAAKSFEQHRNRFNLEAHVDLQELLTNFGSSRFTGGLNLAANLLGKLGKMDVQGHMVQDLFDLGKLTEINDYCRCDSLDTYFVFLRSRVLLGELTLAGEQKLIGAAKELLESKADSVRGFRLYLERWGDWTNPWKPGS